MDGPSRNASPGDAAGLTPAVLSLAGQVQHYAWGDPAWLPAFLGVDNPDGRPFAEYWMGAHPDLPSLVQNDGHEVTLDALIASAPERWLGEDAARRFDGRLPYLFKVLCAGDPLSIQTHPDRTQAREGYRREQAAGIPTDAPERNYKDDNHKPELIAAVTDFWGLCGFRPLDEIATRLGSQPELAPIADGYVPTPDGLRTTYARFMEAPQSEIDAVLDPWVRRLADQDRQRAFEREQPEFWVLRSDRVFSRGRHRDRGLLSVLLLNLVHLRPGQAMYLPARLLHAYLEGTGIELMANSNNVLRGGLTPKHVDVPELLRTVTFDGGPTPIVRPSPCEDGDLEAYRTPAAEFELRRLRLGPGQRHDDPGPRAIEIGLVLESESPITVRWADGQRPRARGECFLVPAELAYSIEATSAATIYLATVAEDPSMA